MGVEIRRSGVPELLGSLEHRDAVRGGGFSQPHSCNAVLLDGVSFHAGRLHLCYKGITTLARCHHEAHRRHSNFITTTTSEAGVIRSDSYTPIHFLHWETSSRSVAPLRDGFFVAGGHRCVRPAPAAQCVWESREEVRRPPA